MDKQRTIFYGFVVGFVLKIVPVPSYFFWVDVKEHIDAIFEIVAFNTSSLWNSFNSWCVSKLHH